MKHVAFASLVLLVAAIALGNGPGGAPPAGPHGPEGIGGEHAIVGSDGTLYLTKVTAAATSFPRIRLLPADASSPVLTVPTMVATVGADTLR